MRGQWHLRDINFSAAALSFALVFLPFSTALCHASLIIFIVLWVWEGRWFEKLSRLKQSPSLQLLIVFVILLIGGLAYTQDVSEGVFFLERKIFFFLVPVAIATTARPWTQKDILLLFYSFTASCFVAMCVCVAYAGHQLMLYENLDPTLSADINYLNPGQFDELNPALNARWLFFSYTVLAKGISIHPTYLALYMAFCTVFLLREVLTQHLYRWQNVVANILILLFTIFIVFLSSRIILLSLATVYLILIFYYSFKPAFRLRVLVMTALLVVTVVVLFLNPVSRYRSWQEFFSSSLFISENHQYDTSVEMRASLWWLGWKSFERNPLAGAGTGDVKDEMRSAAEKYGVTNIINSYNPHNQYLYILIGNGIVALVVFVLYLLMPLVKAWINADYLMMAFTFLFGTLCFTETALELQKGIVFFAIVHSILAFQTASERPAYLNSLSSARS